MWSNSALDAFFGKLITYLILAGVGIGVAITSAIGLLIWWLVL